MSKKFLCFCVVLCFALAGCGATENTSSADVGLAESESVSVVDDNNHSEDYSIESVSSEQNEYESEEQDVVEHVLPDFSNNEKGMNGLPIITYGDIRSNPWGYEQIGLWREDNSGLFTIREFITKPSSFILDGVVMTFDTDGTKYDEFIQSISDFSQVFYMSSGSVDNGLRSSSVEDIKDYLNKHIGQPRSISFRTAEMKELVVLDANIYISITMKDVDVIDTLSVELHTSAGLSEQPLVVFDDIGVNVALLNENGKALSLTFDLQ